MTVFKLCQNWGYTRRRVHTAVHTAVSFDFLAIDLRISYLHSASLSSAYSRQKQSLKAVLEGFLYALPGNKWWHPLDVCRVLVFNDTKGKTQIHNIGCLHLGQWGFFPYKCMPIATGLLHRWFIHWKVTLYFPTLAFQATGIGVSLLVTRPPIC